MKFVHIADMHFDIPFKTLNKKDLGNIRRLEQRRVFKSIIEYIKENNIENFFIAGDLYEHEYIKQSTIEYINNLFKEIPNTKIYITPGNHDPLVKNSYYSKFNWEKNVYIFGRDIKKIEEGNICIYGYGFDSFYMKENKLEQLHELDKDKINILITHCDLDGNKNEDEAYNPISKKELINFKFDYVALGHIHKKTYNDEEDQKIIYPGSTMSLGFDELGSHGMIVGEINEENRNLSVTFIKLDNKEFVEKEIEITNIKEQEELIENINDLEIEEDKYYKIILKGSRNFEINIYNIEKALLNKNIIKIKDLTKVGIDLEVLKNEHSLKGIFVKNMLQKIEENPENKEMILEAIEIGLNAM